MDSSLNDSRPRTKGRLPYPDRPQSNRRTVSRRSRPRSTLKQAKTTTRPTTLRWEEKVETMKQGGELAERMMSMYQNGPIQVSTLRKNYVGKKARRGFLEMIRKSSRLLGKIETDETTSSPKTWSIKTRTGTEYTNEDTLAALQIAQKKSMNNRRPVTSRTCVIANMMRNQMIPEASMVIKKKRTPRLLCLAFKGLNDRRLNALTSAIDQMTRLPGSDMMTTSTTSSSSSSSDYLETIDISHNRLTSIGVCKMIQRLGNSIRSLDLSCNQILGPDICESLNRLLEDKDTILQELNLSSNDVSDRGGVILARSIRQSPHLIRLNLSHCGLKSDAGHTIADALAHSGTVIELDMSWNDIASAVPKLVSLRSVRNLRLCHVSIRTSSSSNSSDEIVKQLSISIEQNKTLLHLNLSGCGLNESDMEILGESLRQNQTLVGLHLGGNCCSHRIDAKGFMFSPAEASTCWRESLSSSALSLHTSGDRGGRGGRGKKSWLNLPPVLSRIRDSSENEVTHDRCWICGGWREVSLLIRLPPIPVSSATTLRVHFSHDDWRAQDLGTVGENSKGGFVEIHRCLPPGRQYFVFTTSENLHVISPQLELENVSIQKFKGIKTMLRDGHRVKSHYVDVKSRVPTSPLRVFHTTIRDKNNDDCTSSPFLGTWKTLRRISIVLNFRDTLLKRIQSFVSMQRKMFESQLVLCLNDIVWTISCEMKDLMSEASKSWGDGQGDWFDPSLAHAFLVEQVSTAAVYSSRIKTTATATEERIKLYQSEFSLRGKHSKNRGYYDTENNLCDRAFVKDWVTMRVDRYVKQKDDLSEMFRLLFVHFRDLSNVLRFWGSRCLMMNRIDLATTIALFESMDCVEEMSEEEEEEEEEENDSEEDTRRRRGTTAGVRGRRRKAHPKCTKRDIEKAYKTAASKEFSKRDDVHYLVRSEFLLCMILVSRILYHLPSQSRERKLQNARRAGKGVVVIYHEDMLSCMNEFVSHYVETFLSRVNSECQSLIGMSIEPDVFRRDQLYFSRGLEFFLEKYEVETRKLFDTYATLRVQSGEFEMRLRDWIRMLRNAGLLKDNESSIRRSSSVSGRRKSSSRRRSSARRGSTSGEKVKHVLLAADKSMCVFAFAQAKEIEIECTSESTEQTLNYLDFLEALCRLAVAMSSSQDRRPMALKLNDMWQRHARGLLSLDTTCVYDRLISVMKNYIPKSSVLRVLNEDGVENTAALDKEIAIREFRAKIESRLATSKEWRTCTRAISSSETFYDSLIRSVL